MDFWTRLDNLIASKDIVIDRPKGTAHPKYPEILYPLDYGYLKDTSAGDGNEVDVWRGSRKDISLNALICTVDIMKNDTEIKLLVGCTEEEIDIVNTFHNNEYMSGIVIKRR